MEEVEKGAWRMAHGVGGEGEEEGRTRPSRSLTDDLDKRAFDEVKS